jgi:hypothetical protein
MEFKTKVGLHNEFDIERKDIRTGEIIQRGKAYNILLNGIYSRLCNRQTFFSHIIFGKGTGTLDPAGTSLFTAIAMLAATTVEEVKDSNNNVYYSKKKIVLLPANYVGETITEVGIGVSGSGTFSHALIQDSEGNQITIGPKTEYDEITIYATVYFQLYDNGNIKWARLPNANALLNYLFGVSLGTPVFSLGNSRMTEMITGSTATFSQISTKLGSYVADIPNKKLKTNIATFEAAEGNGDIFEIGLADHFHAALPVPGIWDGYNVTGEAVGTGDGVNKNFNFKFNYPKNAVIKVNGVPQTEGVDYKLGALKNLTVINSNFIKALPYTITGSIQEASGYKDPKRIMDGGVGSTANYYFIEPAPTYPVWLTVDLGEERYWPINKLRYYANASGIRFTQATIQESTDNATWLDLGVVSPAAVTGWQELGFNMANSPFRYIRIYITSGNGSGLLIDEIEFVCGDQLVFTNPPASTAAITADYSVDQIPKDSDHTLAVSFEIQWGEGVA